jgi:hypothetical protein
MKMGLQYRRLLPIAVITVMTLFVIPWSGFVALQFSDKWATYRDDVTGLNARISASANRFALSILRPRSHGAHPTPHTLADIGSTHSTAERQNRAVV